MSEEELHAKVRQLCDENGTEFLFATSGLVGWNITGSKYLYELSEHIRTLGVEDAENKCINENGEKDFF